MNNRNNKVSAETSGRFADDIFPERHNKTGLPTADKPKSKMSRFILL